MTPNNAEELSRRITRPNRDYERRETKQYRVTISSVTTIFKVLVHLLEIINPSTTSLPWFSNRQIGYLHSLHHQIRFQSLNLCWMKNTVGDLSATHEIHIRVASVVEAIPHPRYEGVETTSPNPYVKNSDGKWTSAANMTRWQRYSVPIL